MINDIKNWFARSETIAWARLQMFIGIVWTVLSVSDLSPLLNPKWLTYWLIFSGGVTEYLRRRGTETVTTTTATGSTAKVLVEVTPPAPPTV